MNHSSSEQLTQEQIRQEQPAVAKENNTIVTPYAFQVSPELLGQPLASPGRRAFAQCIDLTLLYFISSANAMVFALLAAITFMRAGANIARGKNQGAGSKIMRMLGACMLGWVIFVVMDDSNSSGSVTENGVPLSSFQPMIAGMSSLMWQECDNDFACLSHSVGELATAQAELGGSMDDLNAYQTSFMEGSTLDNEQRQALITVMQETFAKASGVELSDRDDDAVPEANEDNKVELSTSEKPAQSFFSSLSDVLHEGQDFLAEIGLSFGWAALYYSVFTAYMKGCTPGKWVTRIRVLRLDGRSPTLWESFGRYGGYGAGFATGFLGFLQIYWDANRQSIQDKIAETLVVRHSVKVKTKSTSSSIRGTSGEGI